MSEPDEWDFWTDEAKLTCCGYDEQNDVDALNVLIKISEKNYRENIASALGLSPQYVGLLQEIFCSVGWCEYGTSPRSCWIDHSFNASELIAKMETWIARKWHPETETKT